MANKQGLEAVTSPRSLHSHKGIFETQTQTAKTQTNKNNKSTHHNTTIRPLAPISQNYNKKQAIIK
jgi:hypothetical protein